MEQELEQEKLQNKENLDDQMANEQKVSNLGAEVLSLEEKVQQLEKELAKSEIMVTDLQQEVESKGIYVYCIHFKYTLYTRIIFLNKLEFNIIAVGEIYRNKIIYCLKRPFFSKIFAQLHFPKKIV